MFCIKIARFKILHLHFHPHRAEASHRHSSVSIMQDVCPHGPS